MNAAKQLVMCLSRAAVERLLGADRRSNRGRTDAQVREQLYRRFALDLAGLLNLAVREELDVIAASVKIAGDDKLTIGQLRARLWMWGAEREAGTRELLGSGLQPVPIVLRGKLVHMREGTGLAPPLDALPRPVPPPIDARAAEVEPETIEELLDNAQALVGARLGAPTRDKGAFGACIARLLGVREDNAAEADWRGEVEIKTVPVVRDRAGWWRVKEDPAVSMEGIEPLTKLRRVLWIARVADELDSPILSWYYQSCDATTRELYMRDLHTRPKGGAGATTRGWYLHKRFFADSGFLRSLNG